MRFIVSGFWLSDGQPFTNRIATTMKESELPPDGEACFVDMDEEAILEAMSPNTKNAFIITSYKVLR